MKENVINRRRALIIIVLLLMLATFLIVLYSSKNREYKFTGYAYKNEIIKIKFSRKTINIVANIDEDSVGLCFFTERIKYFHLMNPLKLNVQIDSLSSIILDTVLIIPNEYKEPVISFEYPTTNHFKRFVFLINSSERVKP